MRIALSGLVHRVLPEFRRRRKVAEFLSRWSAPLASSDAISLVVRYLPNNPVNLILPRKASLGTIIISGRDVAN